MVLVMMVLVVDSQPSAFQFLAFSAGHPIGMLSGLVPNMAQNGPGKEDGPLLLLILHYIGTGDFFMGSDLPAAVGSTTKFSLPQVLGRHGCAAV